MSYYQNLSMKMHSRQGPLHKIFLLRLIYSLWLKVVAHSTKTNLKIIWLNI